MSGFAIVIATRTGACAAPAWEKASRQVFSATWAKQSFCGATAPYRIRFPRGKGGPVRAQQICEAYRCLHHAEVFARRHNLVLPSVEGVHANA